MHFYRNRVLKMIGKANSLHASIRSIMLSVDFLLFRLVRCMVQALPRHSRYRMLLSLSKYYEIEGVVVRGTNGRAEGDLRDEGLFRHYVEERIWSDHILRMIRARMEDNPHGTYIDIGANIGLTTIPLAIKTSWKFFAFEPDPTNFLRLRLNLVRNSAENVVARNVAISDAAGTLTLRKSPNNFGDFRLERHVDHPASQWAGDRYKETDWEMVEVQTLTLDDVMSGVALDGPTIIKIDTQGAEPYIVKGGSNTLSKAALVIMEFWPYGIARQGADPLEFLGELKQLFGSVKAISASNGNLLSESYDDISQLTSKIVATGATDYFDLILTGPRQSGQ
jgi:FkbM family methyltransferase